MNSEALNYFKLGFQFLNSSKLLLEKMVEYENINFVISNNEITEKELDEETKYSDFNIINPILFNYYHGIELIIKGCLEYVGKLQNYSHDIEDLTKDFKNNFSDDEDFKNEIIKLMEKPIELISNFETKNQIVTGKELYTSLRYPDSKSKKYDYSNLMFNNKKILNQCIEIIKNINNIKNKIVKKYQ